ncbi:MAG: sigma 54-interacting transcriptional regulator, partial [Myxococcota bacterium]
RSHLGVVLHKAGALGDAEDAYRAAIEGARVRRDLPSQLLRQNNLATLLHERGRFVDALETYEEIEALAHVLGDKRASVRARMNWANLEGWLGQSESARARAGSALDDAEALEMTSETAYLRLIVSEQLIALGELEFAEDMLHLASEGLESSSIVYAEAQVVQAQLALRRQSPARAFELATAAYNRVEGRDLLRLISGSWVLQAALAGEKPLKAKVEPIGEALQSLAESRADPDYGWLIAAARAQLTDNASAVQSRTQLASQLLATARTRLSAQHERAYSELWWRADLWQGARSARPVADEITRDFDRLLAINRELARDHDPDRLLDRIIDAAIALSGAERGFIVLSADGSREPEEETLEVYLGRNLDRESLQGAELSRSIAARAIRTGGPVTTVDASGDDRFREALSVHELKLRSVLCLPLSTHGGALGALYLDNRYRAHAFSDADVSLLSAFGDQAAIALANARMVSELKTKANELERSRAEVDELNQRLQRELSAQAEELRYAKARNATMTDPGRYGMIGASAAMQRVYTIIERVADKDVTVAIVGESGTGKELVARAIHETSEQTHGAFVPVNCGAIPEQLLESELFGHERGAFTGAVRAKPGLFEVAENGTLFLDEIGDMPMSMQVKLLRVLQQREFRRVGGTDAIRSNAR